VALQPKKGDLGDQRESGEAKKSHLVAAGA
jgi:hypothetical protein